MILDDRSEICTELSLTGFGVGVPSMFGDAFDMSVSGRQLNGLYMMATCIETATSAGAATAMLSIVSAANGSFSSRSVHGSSGAIAVASLQRGRVVMRMPLPGGLYGAYLGLQLTVGGAVFTAGKLSIALTNDPTAWQALARR